MMSRTCIGCRAVESPASLVRIVLGPEGEVALSLGGGAFGRGAWLHPEPSCIARAPMALSRALKATVRSNAVEIWSALIRAAERRIQGLLVAARRKKRLEAGGTAVEAAVLGRRAELVLVARDARAAAEHAWLAPLIASGSARAWGEKALFGAWLSRPDTALVAVTDRGIAQEILKMIDWTMLPQPNAPKPGARRAVSSEAG